MLLSILIPSLQSRAKLLSALLRELDRQRAAFIGTVEVIVAVDNKEATTGFKRQFLLEQAQGEYVCFIDDDDSPFKNYIQKLVDACKEGKDCVAIEGVMSTDGFKSVRWFISKDYDDVTEKTGNRIQYLRHTNHLAPVKRSIALRAGFPDKSNAEDSEYSRRLKESGLLLTEAKVQGLLYHYRFSTRNKEYK